VVTPATGVGTGGTITPEQWIVRRFNDTGHLGTDLDRPPQPLT
jgi:hypothetical protein